jgi:hypothetical protein
VLTARGGGGGLVHFTLVVANSDHLAVAVANGDHLELPLSGGRICNLMGALAAAGGRQGQGSCAWKVHVQAVLAAGPAGNQTCCPAWWAGMSPSVALWLALQLHGSYCDGHPVFKEAPTPAQLQTTQLGRLHC